MTTYNSNQLPSTTGLSLGSVVQRWNAFLQSLDLIGGSVDFTGALITGPVVITNPLTDQTIAVFNLLPASGNTSQSLGSIVAPWILNSESIVNKNAGVFTNAQMNLYAQSIVGGGDPATEFQAFQGPGLFQTEAGTFCLTIPSSATVNFGTALQAYLNQGSTTIPGAALQAIARSTVANVSVHAASFIAMDGGLGVPNNNYYGNEVFMVAKNTASVPVGLLIDGDFFVQPTNAVAQLISAPNSNHAGMVWPAALRFYYGATKPVDANNAAIDLLPAGDGVHTTSQLQSLLNLPSQGIRLTSNDTSSGFQNSAYISELANGNLSLAFTKAGAGLNVGGTLSTTGATVALGGLLTSYNGRTSQANGLALEVSTVNLTAQTAAIAATDLITGGVGAGQGGRYRINWYAKVTTAAGTSSTLGPLTITFTDPDGVAQSITAGAQIAAGTIATTSTGNTTTTVLLGLPTMFNVKGGASFQYAFGYASVAAAAMNYSLTIALEFLG